MQVVTTKEITFQNLDGAMVTIPSNTTLQIDTDDSTASVNGYHFDITDDEYVTVH